MRKGFWVTLIFALALGAAMGTVGSLWWTGSSTANTSQNARPVVQIADANSTLRSDQTSESIFSSRQNAITVAAAEVSPAVVAVSVIQTRVVRAPWAADRFFSQFLVPRYYREQVRSMGSGVIVSPDGYVITSEHVTHHADSIWVTLPDGRTLPAQQVGSDHETDLAVLRVSGVDLPTVSFGDSDSLLIGEWAIALGNPFGYLLEDAKPTVTVGVISAIDRDLRQGADDERVYRKVIQTDAAINPGNSGGPLVNAAGAVIGINAFIFSSSKGSEGIAFAIPSNQARVIFYDLVQFGEVRPAWVGVRLQPLPVVYGGGSGVELARGVLVTGVQPGSPAEQAGMRPGDVLRKAGGRKVSNIADWEGVASYWRAGSRVEIMFRRAEEMRTASLELVERPLTKLEGSNLGRGLWVANVTAEVASELGLKSPEGVVVTRVESDSPSEAAGFQRGDVIRQVNSEAIRDAAELHQILKSGSRRGRMILGLEREGRQYVAAFST